MKKIMMLGGSSYLIPVIESAHRNGYYVITCDYLPDNPAHRYSDEYYNVSVVDKEDVLSLSQKLDIDGIISYACDAGVVTAAYVSEKLGLNFQCPYESAKILQNKSLFRAFLKANGFNCPNAKGYKDKRDAIADIAEFAFPVMVKPVDCAGSKGVSKIEVLDDLEKAISLAQTCSPSGCFIVEEFLAFKGYHSSADYFTVNGKLKFSTYSDQLFDENAVNPYTPSLIIWPSSMDLSAQNYLTAEIQRVMTLLKMKTGIYNIETCVGIDGKPYIMEISPRGGGCKIAEIQHMATGIDLINAEVRNAVGDSLGIIESPVFDGNWCEIVLHNSRDSSIVFKGVSFSSNIKKENIKKISLNVEHGDLIEPFSGGSKAVGDIFVRFDSRDELNDVIVNNLKYNIVM